MNLPTQLQQAVNQWASHQGISSEQFIISALTEKIDDLSHQIELSHDVVDQQLDQQPTLRRKEGVLVVDAVWPDSLEIDAW